MSDYDEWVRWQEAKEAKRRALNPLYGMPGIDPTLVGATQANPSSVLGQVPPTGELENLQSIAGATGGGDVEGLLAQSTEAEPAYEIEDIAAIGSWIVGEEEEGGASSELGVTRGEEEELSEIMAEIDPPWYESAIETVREYGRPWVKHFQPKLDPMSEFLESGGTVAEWVALQPQREEQFQEALLQAKIEQAQALDKDDPYSPDYQPWPVRTAMDLGLVEERVHPVVAIEDPKTGETTVERLTDFQERLLEDMKRGTFKAKWKRDASGRIVGAESEQEVAVHHPPEFEPSVIGPQSLEEAVELAHWGLAATSMIDPTMASDAADAALYKIMGDPETARQVIYWSAGGLGAGALAMKLFRLRKTSVARKALQREFEGTGMSQSAARDAARDAFDTAITRAAEDAISGTRRGPLTEDMFRTPEELWWRDLQRSMDKRPDLYGGAKPGKKAADDAVAEAAEDARIAADDAAAVAAEEAEDAIFEEWQKAYDAEDEAIAKAFEEADGGPHPSPELLESMNEPEVKAAWKRLGEATTRRDNLLRSLRGDTGNVLEFKPKGADPAEGAILKEWQAAADLEDPSIVKAFEEAQGGRPSPEIIKALEDPEFKASWKRLGKAAKKRDKELRTLRSSAKAEAPSQVEKAVPAIALSEDGKWKSGLVELVDSYDDADYAIDDLLRYEWKRDASGRIVRAELKGMLIRASGSSAGEVRASGLADFLADLKSQGRTNVTKKELVEHLTNPKNRVEFGEVRLGELTPELKTAQKTRSKALNEVEQDLNDLIANTYPHAGIDIHRVHDKPSRLLELIDDPNARSTGLNNQIERAVSRTEQMGPPKNNPLVTDPLIRDEVIPELLTFRQNQRKARGIKERGANAPFRAEGSHYHDALQGPKGRPVIKRISKKVNNHYDSLGGKARSEELSDELVDFYKQNLDEGQEAFLKSGQLDEDDWFTAVGEMDPENLDLGGDSTFARWVDDARGRLKGSDGKPLTWRESEVGTKRRNWIVRDDASKADLAKLQEFEAGVERYRKGYKERKKLVQLEWLADDLRRVDKTLDNRARIYEFLKQPATKRWTTSIAEYRRIASTSGVKPPLHPDATLQRGKGENYRTILMTRPMDPHPALNDPAFARLQQLHDQSHPVAKQGWMSAEKELQEATDKLLKKYGEEPGKPFETWKRELRNLRYGEHNGGHHDTLDVFIHIRTTDQYQMGADGKMQKILLVEELQSDINQQARRYGTRISEKKEKFIRNKIAENESRRNQITVETNQRNEAWAAGPKDEPPPLLADTKPLRVEYGIDEAWAKEVGSGGVSKVPSESVLPDLADEYNLLAEEWTTLKRQLYWGTNKYAKPDMGFQKTEEWAQIGTRRAIQVAVEEGYDGVAFIGGRLATPITNFSSVNKKTDDMIKVLTREQRLDPSAPIPGEVRKIDDWLRPGDKKGTYAGALTELKDEAGEPLNLFNQNQDANTGLSKWLQSLKDQGRTHVDSVEIAEYLAHNSYKGSAAHIHYDVRVGTAIQQVTGQKPAPTRLIDKVTGKPLVDTLEARTPLPHVLRGQHVDMKTAYRETPPVYVELTDELKKKMLEPQPIYDSKRIR